MINTLIHKYGQALNQRPILTKVATSAVIGAAGDLLCQGMERYFYNQKIQKGEEWRKQTLA
jgi:hypothetical protein